MLCPWCKRAWSGPSRATTTSRAGSIEQMRDLSRQIASACRKTVIQPSPPLVRVEGGLGIGLRETQRASKTRPPAGGRVEAEPCEAGGAGRSARQAYEDRRDETNNSTSFGPAPAAMARKSRRKKNSNFVSIPFQFSTTVGNLAQNTGVVSNALVPVKDLKIISVDGLWSWTDIAATTDDTLEVGYADADLSLAEIEEYLEISFLDPTDRIAKERAGRHVRRVGIIQGNVPVAGQGSGLNDGKPVRTKLNWKVGTKGLQCWVYNRSSNQYTTGSFCRNEATVYGVWTSQ